MSKWSCPVVVIKELIKHPNADTLDIIAVDGTVCIARSGQWKVGDLAVLVPIDSVVPLDHPEFSFLKKPEKPEIKLERIRAKRLRGTFSDGLLVPLPPRKWYQPKWKPGKDASKALGIFKFEEDPEQELTIRDRAFRFYRKWKYLIGTRLGFNVRQPYVRGPKPQFYLSNGQTCPVYDLDKYKKYAHLLVDREIVVTEKLHGMNCRVVCDKDLPVLGSHHVMGTTQTAFLAADKKYGLTKKMEKLPGHILFGEVLGTQDLKYGFSTEDVGFAAFDIYVIAEKRYLNWEDFKAKCQDLDIPTVPVLFRGMYDPELLNSLVNGPNPKKPLMSALHKGTLREGAVIKTANEAPDARERISLKFVSEAYLLREGGTERH